MCERLSGHHGGRKRGQIAGEKKQSKVQDEGMWVVNEANTFL